MSISTLPVANFPSNALPVNLRNILYEVENHVQSPLPLIVASAFSTIATACQGLFDVRMPTGQIVPLSVFFITVAESGERKTSTDNLLAQPLFKKQEEVRSSFAQNESTFAVSSELWELEHKALKSKIKLAIKKGSISDELRNSFEQHVRQKPSSKSPPRWLYHDATIEALLSGLHSTWPCAALMSSEGSTVLNSRALQHLGMFNELWDGGTPIRVDRTTKESFSLNDARLSLSVMVQSEPMLRFTQRGNGVPLNTGFLARVLVSEPFSRQGMRRVMVCKDAAMPYLEQFRARITELLEQTTARHEVGNPRRILEFAPEAIANWLSFAEYVEQNLIDGGPFSDIRGLASKLTNHVSRLAAIIHVFDGAEGPIGPEACYAATEMCNWYAWEFKRLFGEPDERALSWIYGDILLSWMNKRNQIGLGTDCRLEQLYKRGPLKLRQRDSLFMAIENLKARGFIDDFRASKPGFLRLRVYFNGGLALGSAPLGCLRQ